MTVSGPPVVIVPSGGFPVTQVSSGVNGAAPFTVTTYTGFPITLVAAGGLPMTLLDEDGTDYSSGGGGPPSLNFSITTNSMYIALLADE